MPLDRTIDRDTFLVGRSVLLFIFGGFSLGLVGNAVNTGRPIVYSTRRDKRPSFKTLINDRFTAPIESRDTGSCVSVAGPVYK